MREGFHFLGFIMYCSGCLLAGVATGLVTITMLEKLR